MCSFCGSLSSLSHHEISCPSGEQKSTKQHCVTEEDKFENFPECPQEANEQAPQLQWFLLLVQPLTGVNQLFHVLSLTHSARTQTMKNRAQRNRLTNFYGKKHFFLSLSCKSRTVFASSQDQFK